MIRAVLATTILAAVACGRSKGVPDQELGNLVVETTKPAPPIDVARAAKDPAELGRALMQPYRKAIAVVGPHTAVLAAKTTVDEGGKVVSDMSEQTKLELGDKDAFHGEYTNTADYGREAIFAGDKLYLRPRYQRWHRRAPETADEPLALRDSFFSPVAATWDLLAPGAELSDLGATQVGGRNGRKIAVKLAPKPGKPAAETLTQRKWRETRIVEELTGEVVLDEKGAPLAVKLAGTVSFMRDGRRFKMKTSLTSELSAIGTPVAITAPADVDVVATPERPREVDDRDYLLQGIAPPLRKNPDGTAATPAPAAPPAAPAVAPPAEDKKSEDKKSDEKKSEKKARSSDEDKKSEDKKSEDKKSDEKKSEDKKPTSEDKQPASDVKPDDKGAE